MEEETKPNELEGLFREAARELELAGAALLEALLEVSEPPSTLRAVVLPTSDYEALLEALRDAPCEDPVENPLGVSLLCPRGSLEIRKLDELAPGQLIGAWDCPRCKGTKTFAGRTSGLIAGVISPCTYCGPDGLVLGRLDLGGQS